MHPLDYVVVLIYLAVVLAVGFYFSRQHTGVDDYFVGDRKMGAGHIGLSVVATDVGGGFSIGLGGLGFAMGLAGSWLLFTGLIGAWVTAVILIPKVKLLGDRMGLLTYPELLEARYDHRVRLVAAVVSGLGYAGFVGAQVLAGAKLASGAFGVPLLTAVWVMAAVVVVYTAFGGLKAVIYTDTVQWVIVLGGTIGLALPFAWQAVGGWSAVVAAVPAGHLSLTNIGPMKLLTWMATIVPIWFVGMTLYQRIYATRDVRAAQKAWFIAGLLEYPVMAFVGVVLGMLARVLFPAAEAEMGLPLLLKQVLPVGIAGLVVAAYFSAIMSTADSCLLASVGNLVTDLYHRHLRPGASSDHLLRLSRVLTLVVGFGAVIVALALPTVLEAILLAYAFMVSGLFVPTVAALYWRRASSTAALASMISGGGAAVLLSVAPALDPLGEPILTALPISLVTLVAFALWRPARDARDVFVE